MIRPLDIIIYEYVRGKVAENYIGRTDLTDYDIDRITEARIEKMVEYLMELTREKK